VFSGGEARALALARMLWLAHKHTVINTTPHKLPINPMPDNAVPATQEVA